MEIVYLGFRKTVTKSPQMTNAASIHICNKKIKEACQGE